MPHNYSVVQGECLSSIAAAEGFANWRTIYEDPANADFRQLRPNPNLVFPGDTLVIPDKTPPALAAATGRAFRFTLTSNQPLLRLCFKGGGDLSYTLVIGDVQASAAIADGAILEVAIPPDAVAGQIVTWPAKFKTMDAAGDAAITWDLLIGHLDPADTISGVQARLKNLGYNPGDIDGIDGPNTQAAVRAFQTDNQPLTVDGICGPKTRPILVAAYGM